MVERSSFFRSAAAQLASVAVAVAVGFAAVPLAQSADPSIRAFDLPTIEQLGQAIFEQDIQGARATDILFSETVTFAKAEIRGWIVERLGAGTRVRFIREHNSLLTVAYEVTFIGNKEQSRSALRDEGLDPHGLAQFDARRLALRNIEKPCSQRYNTVALPDPDSDGWIVWALAATTQPDLIILGGHYRFSISGDGKTILRRDALSRSCIAISKTDVPEGAQQVAALVTHLVSDTPVETHVYQSLLHRMLISVSTSDGTIWEVEAGRIERTDIIPGDN